MAVIDSPQHWGYTWDDDANAYVCPACSASVSLGVSKHPWKDETHDRWKLHMEWHRGLGTFGIHYWPVPREN